MDLGDEPVTDLTPQLHPDSDDLDRHFTGIESMSSSSYTGQHHNHQEEEEEGERMQLAPSYNLPSLVASAEAMQGMEDGDGEKELTSLSSSTSLLQPPTWLLTPQEGPKRRQEASGTPPEPPREAEYGPKT